MNSLDILDQINRLNNTSYRLVHKYQHGENQGAYALLDDAGRAFVLKYSQRVGWVARLQHARCITRRLGERGGRVPQYVLVGELGDHWAYCVQSALPGSPAASLSIDQAQQLIAWIELQAGQAQPAEPNWSSYVYAVVFTNESGWVASLRAHSAETRALLGRMQACIERCADLELAADDIVHGDLALENVLLDGEQVSGIVDWDAAGRGDRMLDFAKLLYYGYDNRPARELLLRHMLELRGHESVRMHLVYCILAQLAWSIQHHGQVAVDTCVAQAHTMLDDLERSTNKHE